MENAPFLHVYSPIFHHATSHIIGNKQALKMLKSAIDTALKQQIGEESFFGYDGEEYTCKVIMYDGDKNQMIAVPYTDANAKEAGDTAIWPSDLSKFITERQNL